MVKLLPLSSRLIFKNRDNSFPVHKIVLWNHQYQLPSSSDHRDCTVWPALPSPESNVHCHRQPNHHHHVRKGLLKGEINNCTWSTRQILLDNLIWQRMEELSSRLVVFIINTVLHRSQRLYSSVVERCTCNAAAPGSNPGGAFLFYLPFPWISSTHTLVQPDANFSHIS